MSRHRIALVLGALAIAWISPASAQAPQGTAAGVLSCKLAPSIGLIFGFAATDGLPLCSQRPLPARGLSRRHELNWSRYRYHRGRRHGVGASSRRMRAPMRGKLAGKYVGASGCRRRRRRGRRQRPVWRIQPFDLPAAAVGRGIGWAQPVAGRLRTYAHAGAMSARSTIVQRPERFSGVTGPSVREPIIRGRS